MLWTDWVKGALDEPKNKLKGLLYHMCLHRLIFHQLALSDAPWWPNLSTSVVCTPTYHPFADNWNLESQLSKLTPLTLLWHPVVLILGIKNRMVDSAILLAIPVPLKPAFYSHHPPHGHHPLGIGFEGLLSTWTNQSLAGNRETVGPTRHIRLNDQDYSPT